MARKPAGRKRFRFIRRGSVAPGVAPGTLTSEASATRPPMQLMGFGPGEGVERAITDPGEIRALRGKHPVLWLNVDGVGDASTIKAIGDVFGLHHLALEDVMNTHQRPKVEEYADHCFIVLRMINEGESLETEQMAIFLGKDYVITFQEKPGDCLDSVRQRIRQGNERIRGAGSDYLVYAIIDAVVDFYFPVIEKYGERLEILEDAVIESASPANVARIRDVKHDLLLIRRCVWPLRDALSTLYRDPNPIITAEARIFLRDCYDHAIQIMDLVETYRELGAGLMDIYLSSVSIRTNEVMKVLTIIATIFIPLSFVAGLYGMNFDTSVSPLNMPELGWRFGYPFALSIMAAIALTLILYFRRKGWLGG